MGPLTQETRLSNEGHILFYPAGGIKFLCPWVTWLSASHENVGKTLQRILREEKNCELELGRPVLGWRDFFRFKISCGIMSFRKRESIRMMSTNENNPLVYAGTLLGLAAAVPSILGHDEGEEFRRKAQSLSDLPVQRPAYTKVALPETPERKPRPVRTMDGVLRLATSTSSGSMNLSSGIHSGIEWFVPSR